MYAKLFFFLFLSFFALVVVVVVAKLKQPKVCVDLLIIYPLASTICRNRKEVFEPKEYNNNNKKEKK